MYRTLRRRRQSSSLVYSLSYSQTPIGFICLSPFMIMIEISNCLVDTTKYEQVTQRAQPRKHAHFCIRPYRGFSTSCIGAWPGGVPGIVFTRPWKWAEIWGKGRSDVDMKWVYRTSFSNMHLLSTRSGFLQGAYSYSTVFSDSKGRVEFRTRSQRQTWLFISRQFQCSSNCCKQFSRILLMLMNGNYE